MQPSNPRPSKFLVAGLNRQFKNVFSGLGFNIRGGADAPHLPGNPGIFVTSIRPGGVADRDRRLKRGDRLLEVFSFIFCSHRLCKHFGFFLNESGPGME